MSRKKVEKGWMVGELLLCTQLRKGESYFFFVLLLLVVPTLGGREKRRNIKVIGGLFLPRSSKSKVWAE